MLWAPSGKHLNFSGLKPPALQCRPPSGPPPTGLQHISKCPPCVVGPCAKCSVPKGETEHGLPEQRATTSRRPARAPPGRTLLVFGNIGVPRWSLKRAIALAFAQPHPAATAWPGTRVLLKTLPRIRPPFYSPLRLGLVRGPWPLTRTNAATLPPTAATRGLPWAPESGPASAHSPPGVPPPSPQARSAPTTGTPLLLLQRIRPGSVPGPLQRLFPLPGILFPQNSTPLTPLFPAGFTEMSPFLRGLP